MAQTEGVKPSTSRFVAECSIQLSYVCIIMEGKMGIEPTFKGFADLAVTIPTHFPVNMAIHRGYDPLLQIRQTCVLPLHQWTKIVPTSTTELVCLTFAAQVSSTVLENCARSNLVAGVGFEPHDLLDMNQPR